MLAEITQAVVFLNVANFLYLICYSLKDVFWLRIFCVTAMFAIIPYYVWGTYVNGHYVIQWECIYWQLAFVAINLFWIIVIIRQRQPPKMSDREKHLYDDIFARSCSPQEMLRLLSVANRIQFKSGETIVDKLSHPEGLMLIESGLTRVEVDDRVVANLERGDFVCEMSYLTGEPAVANVIAASSVEMIRWERGALNKIFEGRPELKSGLHEIIGRDLIAKIASKDQTIPELEVETISM